MNKTLMKLTWLKGVPGAWNPPTDISATDRALLTVVAPEMTEGGTEEGAMDSGAW